jgi:glycosyltransferase involved in cell wall biosynthesis
MVRSARLRIGIDAHAVGKRQTGNERFMANVIRALRGLCDHELVLFAGSDDAAGHWATMDRTSVVVMRPGNVAARLGWWFPVEARRRALDVLLVQYVGPPVVRCPVVTVVHDVAFAVYPSYYSRGERMWMPMAIPRTMRRSAGVVTVSEFSASEIRRLYRIPAEWITVAPNGVDPVFLSEASAASSMTPPYFLAVGNLQPRKNLVTLIRAYRSLVARRPDLPERLVIVGQGFYAAAEVFAEAEGLRRSGRIAFTGYVQDEELVALLRSATAFAYPSVYEGFGLPAVEAMAVGTPVAVSDVPVMREVVGDAAVRLPATDVGAWADALERLSADAGHRQALIVRGRDRAARYTWEACAAQVLRTLERAAAERSTDHR